MLQAQNTQVKRARALPGVVALIFSAILVVGAVVGGTHAYLMSKTDTYVNTFVSGLPAAGELTIEGTKSLEGRSLIEGEFSFELYETGADFEVAEDADPLQTAANEANGAFAFSPIECTQVGDYYYVVTEKIPAQGEQGFLDHVTYDKTQYRIIATVTESNGSYVVDSEIVSYDPEVAAAALNPQTGSAPAASGELSEGGENAGAGTDRTADGANPAADSEGGTTPEDLAVPAPASDEPATDPASQDVVYTGTEVTAITFKNKFDSPDPTVVINGVKTLDGRDMKAGEFTFELYKANDKFEVASEAKPVQSVSNTGEGAQSGFGFAALSFSKAGTYRYVICEKAGALGGVTYDDEVYRLEIKVEADTATAVLSASAKMYVQNANGDWAEVAVLQPNEQGVLDNPEGKPYVAEDPQNADCAVAYVTFANIYKTTPASYELIGDVDLNGRDMNVDEFAFTVEPVTEGAPVPDASRDTNDADGGFSFGSVNFDAPGVYEYLIKQDASAALEGITYDDSVHRVIVMVTDEGNGRLVKEVVVLRDGVEVTDGTGVKYVNAYEKPDGGEDPVTPPDPGTDNPDDGGSPIPGGTDQGGTDLEQTGDDTRLLVFASAAMALASVLFAAVAFVQLRRRS